MYDGIFRTTYMYLNGHCGTIYTSHCNIVSGISQLCYDGTECTGEEFVVASARECCVETDIGKSFSDDAGSCIVTECIGNISSASCLLNFTVFWLEKLLVFLSAVHGFLHPIYEVIEQHRLDTVFQLNVKGTSPSPPMMLGDIILERGTAGE